VIRLFSEKLNIPYCLESEVIYNHFYHPLLPSTDPKQLTIEIHNHQETVFADISFMDA